MASEFVGTLLALFYVLLAAQLVGWVFRKLNQPSVIGEVVAGMIIGPAVLGIVHEGEILDFIAELGAIFLLFLVGIETRLKDILGVGKEAVSVGVLGVIIPFVAGWGFSRLIGFDQVASLFVGTALVATSVGITARVLQELGVLSRTYSRIILGAAVIDDVLGLILLAVVSGVAITGAFVAGDIALLILFSFLFVVGSAAMVPVMSRLPMKRLPFSSNLAFGLVLGVGMAALSAVVGLAPIVGAFFAGMLLAELAHDSEGPGLEAQVHGVAALLTPVFFAVVGIKLDILALTDPFVLVVGSALTLIAVIGKLVGGLGALSQGIPDASVVGMGMVPRGEVGLIVVALGLSSGAVDNTEYAIVLFVVVATTLIAPLFLRPMVRWAQAAKSAVDEPATGSMPDPPGPRD